MPTGDIPTTTLNGKCSDCDTPMHLPPGALRVVCDACSVRIFEAVGPTEPMTWNDARRHGVLWWINHQLQTIGLSVYLRADAVLDDGSLSEPIAAVLAANPCRGFEDDGPAREAFSKWLAENALRNHRLAFPDDIEDAA